MKKILLLLCAVFVGSALACSGQEVAHGTHNGHPWVDLGLSVKWAKYNVGTEDPSESGSYFAWGETSPKDEYTDANCLTTGVRLGDISGNPEYDAARSNWGGEWRMPTKDEYQELIDNCNIIWDPHRKGILLQSKVNGGLLFLPAVGQGAFKSEYKDGIVIQFGRLGAYVSSTPDTDHYSFGLNFSSENCSVVSYFGRSGGYSIRPVLN